MTYTITGTLNGEKKSYSVSGPATEREAAAMVEKSVPGFVREKQTEKPQPKGKDE